jgi:hypothetical protein
MHTAVNSLSSESVTDRSQNKNPGEVDLDRAQRLRQARIAAGFESASAAASSFGWPYQTYASHENANRNIGHKHLVKYAKALCVPLDWLAYGRGVRDGGPARVRVEGYVSGNLQINVRPAETPDEIPDNAESPPGISADTLHAWRFVGEDGAPFWHDNDVVYTLRDHDQPSAYLGRFCVVRLADDRILIRILRAYLGGRRYLLDDPAHKSIEAEIIDAEPIAWTRHQIGAGGKF